MAAGDHFDARETRDPEDRDRDSIARLIEQLIHARANTTYFAEALANVDPAAVTDRAALARLPVLRKGDLIGLQGATPPYGGLVAANAGAIRRVFMSPGPIYEPQGEAPDYWHMARALHAAGLRRGHLILNAFTHHLTPAGAMLESAALALGCTVIPAGGGNTEQLVRVVADLKPDAYVGVPDFLKILLDKADASKLDTSSLRNALVSGAALPGSLREELSDRGVSVLQCYATADVGLIAYESALDGVPVDGMVVDEDVLVEIVRPGTGDPVREGEVGEVVVTTFDPLYPLVRFATGDLSAVLPGSSPCGRTNMRLRGWMGRADQTAKVRGMFVRPEQIAEIAARHPEIVRARLVILRAEQRDAMTLRCEADGSDDALAAAIAQTVSDVTKLRAAVELVGEGALPNDGKVIDDTRPVE